MILDKRMGLKDYVTRIISHDHINRSPMKKITAAVTGADCYSQRRNRGTEI